MKKSFENRLGLASPGKAARPRAFDHPLVAEAVEKLAEDWPYIARCAEHPLTEYFLLKERRRRFRLNRIPIGLFIWSAVWIAAMIALVVFFNYIGGVVAFGMCAIERALHNRIFKKYAREVAEPIDILEECDAGKREHLYLAPIHFDDLLGAAAVYYRYHWPRYVAGLFFVIAAVMCFFLGLAYYITQTTNYGSLRPYGRPLYAAIAVIFAGIAWLACRPNFIMAIGIRNLYAKLMEKSKQVVALREPVFMQATWMWLAATPLISLAVLSATYSFWVWIVTLVLACIIECRMAARRLDSVISENFARYSESGEEMYANLFRAEREPEMTLTRDI